MDDRAVDRGRTGKAEDESGASSATSLLPRIHLPGHKGRQESRDGRAARDADHAHHSHARTQSQLQLQHLGINLHVPIKRTHSHRHTRSDVPSGSYAGHDNMATNGGLLQPPGGPGGNKSMLSRVTSNLSSRNLDADGKHHHRIHHQHSSSDFPKSWHTAGLVGGVVPGHRPGMRRRATSDPKAPLEFASGAGYGLARYAGPDHANGQLRPAQEQRPPMSELEVLLYKAEKAKKEADENVTEADLQKLTTQLAESRVELQEQLGDANRSSQGLMRRLDDAYDTLRSTTDSLLDTISSFQNLCLQSDTLIQNFETRSGRLKKEMGAALEKQKAALLKKRGTKITKLEERGKKAGDRAVEMSRRLENCRTIIKNFTEREQTKRRAWKGVIVGSMWGCAIIVFGILLGFGLWWYQSYGSLVKHELYRALSTALDSRGMAGAHDQVDKLVRASLHAKTHGNDSMRLQMLENVPEEVKAALDDIAQRHNDSLAVRAQAAPSEAGSSSANDLDDDKRLKKLFDKLEL